jgi:hypothetical protein
MMFTKIFESMYDGTLRSTCPWQAMVTFQQFLILSDQEGFVDMTPEAISFRTGIPLEIIQVGIAALEQPDPGSRRREEEGRRIVRIADHRAWGWQIVNYTHYLKIRSEEERREYQKNLMRNRREKAKNDGAVGTVSNVLADVSNVSPQRQRHCDWRRTLFRVLEGIPEKGGKAGSPKDMGEA